MKKALFVCIHNSARSQMAEAYLNLLGKNQFIAESAGLEPGKLNPFVVKAMQLDGIDISGNDTKSVDDILKAGKTYDLVVTVCDEASAERCPVFPGGGKKLHWGFPDPSSFQGSEEERLQKTIEVRNMIRHKIESFLKEQH
ncbi:MAG: arsenate reductase ArsC [Bacteroidia bacterium]